MNGVKGPTLRTSKIGRMGHPKNQGKNRAVVKVGHPPAAAEAAAATVEAGVTIGAVG